MTIRIDDHFTRFICPVSYDPKQFGKLVAPDNPAWKKIDHRNELIDHFLPHIIDYLFPENGSATKDVIVLEWEPKEFANVCDYLRTRVFTFAKDYTTSEDPSIRYVRHFKFRLDSVLAYLFSNGSGFIVLETALLECALEKRQRTQDHIEIKQEYNHGENELTTEDLIDFNHFFKTRRGDNPRLFPIEPASFCNRLCTFENCLQKDCFEAITNAVECHRENRFEDAVQEIYKVWNTLPSIRCDNKDFISRLKKYTRFLEKKIGKKASNVWSIPTQPNPDHPPKKVYGAACFKVIAFRSPEPKLHIEDELITPGISSSDLINLFIDKLMSSSEISEPVLIERKYVFGLTYLNLPNSTLESSFSETIYHLHRFSRFSYRPAARDLDMTHNRGILQTHENIVFAFSKEGGAVITFGTETRFLQEFCHHVRKRYFLHYILSLNQRQVLRNLAKEVSWIPTALTTGKMNPEKARNIGQIRFRILDFVLRTRFYQVSDSTNHNRVYERWCEILEIEPLLKELKNEVEQIDDYIRNQKLDQEQKILNRLQYFIILLFPLTLITSFYGMNLDFTANLKWSDFLFWIPSSVTMAVFALICLWIFWKSK